MKRIPLAALLVAALPFPALANDCAHGRDIDLALDLAGVESVRF